MLHSRGPLQILGQAMQTLSLCMAEMMTRACFPFDSSFAMLQVGLYARAEGRPLP